MDDAAVVPADRPGLDRGRNDQLLEVLDRLGKELGGEKPSGWTEEIGAEAPPVSGLGAEEEQLVLGLRAGLLRLAGSSQAASSSADAAAAVRSALDGAEFVIRREIVVGRSERISGLLPSFAFLVLLPSLGRAEGLRAAARVAQLAMPAR